MIGCVLYVGQRKKISLPKTKNLLLLLVGSLSISLPSCYYLTQGAVFVRHRMEAVEIDRVRSSIVGDVSVEARKLRVFFNRVERIRNFGNTHLSLSLGKSYQRYLDLESDYLVAVVNATPPHSLEPYLWHYLFFGPAPYRGFYNPEHAREEAKKLQSEGYEVYVRKVDAFSTLGLSSDPLISFMRKYSEFDLAQLIIHEQIHATLWVDGAIQFNEELATSMATQGALEYLAHQYGDKSEELRLALVNVRDAQRYFEDMRDLARRVNSHFAQLSLNADTDSSLPQTKYPLGFIEKRDEIIQKFKKAFVASYDDHYLGERYRAVADIEMTTAFISLYQTYSARGKAYTALYEHIGSTGKTLQAIQSALAEPQNYASTFKAGDDPYLVIEDLLKYYARSDSKRL